MALPISLQLYTVRGPMAEDPEGTLRQIAKMGIRYVEVAGFAGRTAAEFKKILDDLGLRASGTHIGLDVLGVSNEAVIEHAHTLKCRYVICPFLAAEKRTPEGYRWAAETLSRAGRELRAADLTVCYHNHSFEFEPLSDGRRGYDILVQHADPEALQLELDVYWVRHGNDDPIAWIEKLYGRVPLLHIKDMDATPQRGFAEVGTGIIDMAPIVHAADRAGVKYLVLEQDDNWKGSPIESVRTSFNNLRNLVG